MRTYKREECKNDDLYAKVVFGLLQKDKTAYAVADKDEIVYSYFILDGVHYLQEQTYTVKQDGEEMVYDVKTKTNSYNLATNELVQEFEKVQKTDSPSGPIITFAVAVASGNEHLSQAIMDMKYGKNASISIWPLERLNALYALMTKHQDLLEQIIKSSPNLLYQNIEEICLEEKSIKKSVGLPQSVVNFIVKKNLEYIVPFLRTLAENDANDAIIYCEFLSSLKSLIKRPSSKSSQYTIKMLTSKVVDAMAKNKEYRIKETLNYILRQTMYHREWTERSLLDAANYLKDYIHMRSLMDVKEKFPSNLFEAHDLLARNIKSVKLSGAETERFMEAVDAYKCLEMTIDVDKVGKYVFLAPTSPRDLVSEGTALKHCVGSYAKLILRKESRIMFMRNADNPSEPFVTLEVGKDGKIVEAKGAMNSEVSPEISKVLSVYERKIRSVL